MRRLLIVTSTFWLLMVACAGTPVSSSDLTVARICANPGEYEGREISFEVSFKGWKGNCSGPPPVSRSDWMVDDGTGCLYVHGPLPVGLDPLRPKDDKIALTGILRISGRGVPYIDITAKSSSVPGLR